MKNVQINCSVRRKFYVCQVCEEVFERSYQLKRHCFIGDHRGDRNIAAISQPAEKTKPVPTPPAQSFTRQPYKLSSTVAQTNGMDLNDQSLIHIGNTIVHSGKPPLPFGAQRLIPNKTNYTQNTFVSNGKPPFQYGGVKRLISNKANDTQNTFVNNGRPPIQYGAKRSISNKANETQSTFVNNGKPPLQYCAKRSISNTTNVTKKINDTTQQPLPQFKIEGLTKINNTAHIKVKVEVPSPVPSNDSRTIFSEDRWTHCTNHNFQKSNGNITNTPNTVNGSSKYFTTETEHEWNQIAYEVLDSALDEILLKCAVCNFAHSNLHVIDKHLTIHNGAPFRFQCQLCDAWFGQQRYLINHVNSHTVSYFYKCDWCEMSFKSSESLRVHTADEDPECTFDSSGHQLFQCDVCRKTFLNEHLFRSHNTDMHEGGKPYKCDICKAEYYHLASLTKHYEYDLTCELPIKVECP